jgi:hypothetical protein
MFHCTDCDYETINIKDYKKQLQTYKHRRVTTNLLEKSAKEYICVCCNYYTSNTRVYNKHINTM